MVNTAPWYCGMREWARVLDQPDWDTGALWSGEWFEWSVCADSDARRVRGVSLCCVLAAVLVGGIVGQFVRQSVSVTNKTTRGLGGQNSSPIGPRTIT